MQMYQKTEPYNKTHWHYSKIPKLVLATGKPEKSSQKVNKIFKKYIEIFQQPLQYWEMGLPIYQIQMY